MFELDLKNEKTKELTESSSSIDFSFYFSTLLDIKHWPWSVNVILSPMPIKKYVKVYKKNIVIT